jgi:hypothetical protein
MGRARSSEKSTVAKASPLLGDRLAAIRACERSGETLNAYAARTGVSVSTLYEARRRARSLGLLPPYRSARRPTAAKQPSRGRGATRFVEATVRPAPRDEAFAWRLRFPGGEILEAMTPLGPGEAVRLVELLGGRR